jgi:hypothetical protein
MIARITGQQNLVEDGPVGAEKGILQLQRVSGADMEHLTSTFYVSIVACKCLTINQLDYFEEGTHSGVIHI